MKLLINIVKMIFAKGKPDMSATQIDIIKHIIEQIRLFKKNLLGGLESMQEGSLFEDKCPISFEGQGNRAKLTCFNI